MDICMTAQVAMLRIYPSIMASTVRHFLQLPVRGVVLQCYGAGNIPSDRTHLTPPHMVITHTALILTQKLSKEIIFTRNLRSLTQPAASGWV